MHVSGVNPLTPGLGCSLSEIKIENSTRRCWKGSSSDVGRIDLGSRTSVPNSLPVLASLISNLLIIYIFALSVAHRLESNEDSWKNLCTDGCESDPP